MKESGFLTNSSENLQITSKLVSLPEEMCVMQEEIASILYGDAKILRFTYLYFVSVSFQMNIINLMNSQDHPNKIKVTFF